MKNLLLMTLSALAFMIIGFSFQVLGMEDYKEKNSTSIRNSVKNKYLFNKYSVNNDYLSNSYSSTKYTFSDAISNYSATKYSITYPLFTTSDSVSLQSLQNTKEENQVLLPFSSSSDDSQDDELQEDNWNKYGLIFNKIISELSLPNNTKNEEELLADSFLTWEMLHQIGESFVDNAMLYGRIIIREYKLPVHEKTIKPVDIGVLLEVISILLKEFCLNLLLTNY